MKTILILCAAILIGAIAALAWKSLSGEDHFGHPFAGVSAAAIPDLVDKPEAFLGKPVSVQGVLKRQCPVKGCWFYLTDPADPSGKELKIEMGDTTPQLPKRVGRSTHVEGQLIKYGDEYEFIGVAVTFEKEGKS